MFTGLIQDLGKVCALRGTRDAGLDLVLASRLSGQLNTGDSLAVNGVCLTVTQLNGPELTVTCVPETLRRTTLGELQVGVRCNLEPALAVGTPLGGHFVQGHVDGTGTVLAVTPVATGKEVAVQVPVNLIRYVVPKGSIAIDGVSLTVAELNENQLQLALIPHTLQQTTLGAVQPKQRVNIEVDILAKYVERMLTSRTVTESKINEHWLREHGFA